MEGLCQIDVHEIDEVVTGDRARLKLPHRRDQRQAYVEGWWPEADWLPTSPGGVSPRWKREWQEGKAAAYEFVRQRAGKHLADIIIEVYDDFHGGRSKVSRLARDCHYAETVSEGIRERVPVPHFALEALSAVATPRIRERVMREYKEAVERKEQKPIF